MKRHLLAGLLTLALTQSAFAHTHLKSSTPANDSTVASAPAEFVLGFEEPARLTALSIQADGGKEQKIDKLPAGSAAQFTIPAPKLGNGHYTLNYRVVGNDGHVMTGKIGFTVGGKPSAGTGADDHHHEGH